MADTIESLTLEVQLKTEKANAEVASLTKKLEGLQKAAKVKNNGELYKVDSKKIKQTTAALAEATKQATLAKSEFNSQTAALNNLVNMIPGATKNYLNLGIALGGTATAASNNTKAQNEMATAITNKNKVVKQEKAFNDAKLQGMLAIHQAMGLEISSTQQLANAHNKMLVARGKEILGTKQLTLSTSALGNQYDFLEGVVKKLDGSMNNHIATQDKLEAQNKKASNSIKGRMIRAQALKSVISNQLLSYDQLVKSSTKFTVSQKIEMASTQKLSLVKLRKVAAENKELETARQLTSQINGLNAEIHRQTALLESNTKSTTKNSKAKSSHATGSGTSNGVAGFFDTMRGTDADGEKIGTSFGHKVATTAQYATAGSGIYALVGAFKAAGAAALEFDKSASVISAVLNVTDAQATALGHTLEGLGVRLGGTMAEINQAAIALGRAGLDFEDIADGTEVVMKLALLTGDSIADATSAISSYRQVFKDSGLTILQFGDQLAYMANKSRLSTQDIGTFSNYALAAAKSLGLTSEHVGGLATAFSNFGLNASTIGTQIRKLSETIKTETAATEQFFAVLGTNQAQLLTDVQQGGELSKEAFAQLIKDISNLSQEEYNTAVAKLPLLQKNVIDTIRKTGDKIKMHTDALFDAANNNALAEADKIAVSYAKAFERIENAILKTTTAILDSGLSTLMNTLFDLESNDAFQASLESITEKIEFLARSIGIVAVAFISYKTILFALSKVTKIYTYWQGLSYTAMLMTNSQVVVGTAALKTYTATTVLASRAWRSLTAVMAANPIGLVLIGATTAAIAFAEAMDDVDDANERVAASTKKIVKAQRDLTASINDRMDAVLEHAEGYQEHLDSKELKRYEAILATQTKILANDSTNEAAILQVERLTIKIAELKTKMASIAAFGGYQSKATLLVTDDDISKASKYVAAYKSIERIGKEDLGYKRDLQGFLGSINEKLRTSLKLHEATGNATVKDLDNIENAEINLIKRERERDKLLKARDNAANKYPYTTKLNNINVEIKLLGKVVKAKKLINDLEPSSKNSDSELSTRERLNDQLEKYQRLLSGATQIKIQELLLNKKSADIAFDKLAFDKENNDHLKKKLNVLKSEYAIKQELQTLDIARINAAAKAISLSKQTALLAGMSPTSTISVGTQNSDIDDIDRSAEYETQLIDLKIVAIQREADAKRSLLELSLQQLKIEHTRQAILASTGDTEKIRSDAATAATAYQMAMDSTQATLRQSYAQQELDVLQLTHDKEQVGLDAINEKLATKLSYIETTVASFEASATALSSMAGLDETFANAAGSLGSVISASASFAKDDLKFRDKRASIEKKYDKQLSTAIEGTKRYAKIEAKKAKALEDTSNAQFQSDMANGAALAGAAKGFFDEKTAAFKILQGIEMAMHIARMAQMAMELPAILGLTAAKGAEATANASASIAAAGSGDPYTAPARVAVMIGLMGAALAMIGGSASGSANSASTIQSQTRTTVLGGGDDTSESISNSVEILEDFAEPQYGVLTQMSVYLESIDKNIGNIGLDVIRTGEYALGVGVDEYQSSYEGDSLNDVAVGATALLGGVIGLGIDKLLGGAISGGISKALGAFGLGGGGYNWQRLADSGIAFGTSQATAGSTFTASESKYISSDDEARSQQEFQNQTLSDLIDNFQGLLSQTIAYESMSKSFYGSASYSYSSATSYEGMEDELRNSLVKTFSNMRDVILTGSAVLDREVEDTLNNLEVDIGTISLAGLEGDEISEKLTTEFSEQADRFITGTYGTSLSAFQDIGEGLFETFIRVSAGMGEAEYYLDRLGESFEVTDFEDIVDKYGNVGVEALRQSIESYDEIMYGASNGVVELLGLITTSAEDVYTTYNSLNETRGMFEALTLSLDGISQATIVGTDGIDNLNSSLETFIEDILSEDIGSQYTLDKVSKSFENLNLVMPTTVDGFVRLVQGIDTTSEAGQELLGRVLALSSGFSEVADIIKKSAENIKDFMNNFKSERALAEEALKAILDDNELSALQPITLASNFTELHEIMEILSSDTLGLTDAERGLLEANRALIESENELRASKAQSQYEQLLAWNDLKEQFDIQEFGLSFIERLEVLKENLDELGFDELTLAYADLLEDMSGLTEEYNKETIDQITPEITALETAITALDTAITTIGTTISKIRDDASGDTDLQTSFQQSLDALYEFGDKTTKEFSDALKSTLDKTSFLFQSSNFGSLAEQRFAQGRAALQLEELQAGILTDSELLQMQLDSLNAIKTEAEKTSQNTLTLTEGVMIGDTATQVLDLDGLIQAIHAPDWNLSLGQNTAQAIEDVFDETMDIDLGALEDWMVSESQYLDITGNGIADIAKGLTDLGERYIDMDTNGDGIMDIRIMQDASGNSEAIQTLTADSTNAIILTTNTLENVGFKLGDLALSTDDLATAVSTIDLGGVSFDATIDDDQIAALQNATLSISLGADASSTVADLSSALQAQYDWNINTPAYFEFVAKTENASFDWNEDGTPDALKHVNPDGSITMVYDLDSDTIADLELTFNNAGVLTNIVTAEQDVANSMRTLNTSIHGAGNTIETALDSVSGLDNLGNLGDLSNLVIEADFSTESVAKLNELQSLETIDLNLQSEVSDAEFITLRDAVLDSNVTDDQFNTLKTASLDSEITLDQFNTLKTAAFDSTITADEFNTIKTATLDLGFDVGTIPTELDTSISVDDLIENGVPDLGTSDLIDNIINNGVPDLEATDEVNTLINEGVTVTGSVDVDASTLDGIVVPVTADQTVTDLVTTPPVVNADGTLTDFVEGGQTVDTTAGLTTVVNNLGTAATALGELDFSINTGTFDTASVTLNSAADTLNGLDLSIDTASLDTAAGTLTAAATTLNGLDFDIDTASLDAAAVVLGTAATTLNEVDFSLDTETFNNDLNAALETFSNNLDTITIPEAVVSIDTSGLETSIGTFNTTLNDTLTGFTTQLSSIVIPDTTVGVDTSELTALDLAMNWNTANMPSVFDMIDNNGAITIQYDMDQDGLADLALAFDESGVLQDIATYTKLTAERLNTEAKIKEGYQTVFGRDPEASGLETWINEVERLGLTSDELNLRLAQDGIDYTAGPVYNDDGSLAVSQEQLDSSYQNATDYLINYAYRNLLGREVATSGYNYWSSSLLNQSDSVEGSNFLGTIAQGGYENGEITAEEFVTIGYNYGLGREPMPDGLDYWATRVEDGSIRPEQLFETMKVAGEANGETWTPFADGGIVTGPVNALIGEAGYNEAVIPLKDPNDPLQMGEVVNELKALRRENQDMKMAIYKIAANSDRQLTTQRGILSEAVKEV